MRRVLEGTDGLVYIGTAYSGLVYRLDPDSGEVTSIGSPPVESTPWIFWMELARNGKIYGAKGVGLFELEVETGEMLSLGLVPGEHQTPLISSAPIVRCIHELPDGSLIGDTNRCLWRYIPDEARFEVLADMLSFDDNGVLAQSLLVDDFGTGARGFFHLPGPDAILSIESDGSVNGYSLASKERFHARGPIPLPSGPAVDPERDCWYFSSDVVARYELEDARKGAKPNR